MEIIFIWNVALLSFAANGLSLQDLIFNRITVIVFEGVVLLTVDINWTESKTKIRRLCTWAETRTKIWAFDQIRKSALGYCNYILFLSDLLFVLKGIGYYKIHLRITMKSRQSKSRKLLSILISTVVIIATLLSLNWRKMWISHDTFVQFVFKIFLST